jgi:hypothetical protein
MSFSDETLMAYTDGELDAATAAALEQALAGDAALAQRVARARALRARLQDAFAPVLTEPVPERLLAAMRAAPGQAAVAKVIPLPVRTRAPARWSWPQWGAMAASLVVGALLGPLLLKPSAPQPALATSGGRLLANGALSQALTQRPASAPDTGAPVAIGVSFRARGGNYCRSFVLHETQPLAGLACREGSAWEVVALAQAGADEAAGGGYRQAASALPPAVARSIDELIDGEPLDAAAEAAARAHDWRR